MDELLDILWSKIVIGVGYAVAFLDMVLAPLENLGPGMVILIVVLVTVCLTKIFSKYYTTKRYERLKSEFTHWFNLRQEALACEDREKGKRMARNIDQGKLNRVYYDYFFEGLLKNILTIYLPVLVMGAYINEAYQPQRLTEKFGQPHIVQFGGSGEDPVVVGALFFYVVLVLATYLLWAILARLIRRRSAAVARNENAPDNKSASSQPPSAQK